MRVNIDPVADHDIQDLRQDYDRGALSEGDLGLDPIAAFGTWMATALDSGVPEPHAAAQQ